MNRILIAIGVFMLVSCSDDPAPVDCSLSDLALENIISETMQPSNCSAADGVLKVSASGGAGGYQYAVNGGALQTSGVFTNLSPGIFSFSVRDNNNCEVTLDNIALMTAGLAYNATVTDNTKCVGGNGSITIDVQEGVPPYQFKFGEGEFAAENVFSSLPTGNYQISLKDAADCTAQLSIHVPQGLTNTSWSTEILPIIQSSCAVSGCHNGVTRSDLRIYSNAKFYAAVIKTYTQDGYMPFEGTITQDQIDLIACWVDEGAPEN